MRKLIGLFLCLALAACIQSNVDSKRTARAVENLERMRSLLVFVESASADSSQKVETVVVKELRDSGVTVQLGSAHITYDAPINQVFAKAEALGVDGTLVIAVESTGIEIDRSPPNPEAALVGQYSARLHDMRTTGKHPRVWQAKVNARTGNRGLRSSSWDTSDITAHAVRQIVSELEGDDMITRAER